LLQHEFLILRALRALSRHIVETNGGIYAALRRAKHFDDKVRKESPV